MKKLICILISTVLCFSLLSGCSNGTSPADSADKIHIVCTIFPQYDWVMNIIGNHTDKYNVSLLVENGTDLHSFQPGAKDIVTISNSDLFIYTGGESDAWVHDVLQDTKNEDRLALSMMEIIGDAAFEEEVVEGMDEDSEHEDHEENSENSLVSDHSEEDIEYDEHVWLSLKNAQTICKEIASALCELNPDDANSIESNYVSYNSKLASLDSQYSDSVNSVKRKVLLFGDRFPFRYMIEDYNLDYYAAFAGCSAETEASFKTIVFLAKKVDELQLPVVCVTESSDQSVAKTIIENTRLQNQKILTFDSMQSVSKNDIDSGISYLEIMESNLSVLKEALN